MAAISPQNTFEEDSFLSGIVEYRGDQLNAIEPSYDEIIDPRSIRRMSKIIRMGVAASRKALEEAGVELPDGIITGTSYGCLADTESFLHKLIDNKEEALNPTPFIQSTHNTISGQIALLLQCFGYNSTYTQRGFSFENSLQDAQLLIDENPDQNLLVGGVDEIIDVSHRILSKFKLYRKSPVSNLALLKQPGEGTMNGEGSAYFVVTGDSQNSLAEIKFIKTFYKSENASQTTEVILNLLKENSVETSDIDVLLTGRSGDLNHDSIYENIENLFPEANLLNFKHLCGEFPTASAFATWVAGKMLLQGHLPQILMRKASARASVSNVLIYNHYFGVHHSLILLAK